MALRAGYFGLKRFEKNKLSILAASMPADISPVNPIAGKNDVLASIDLLDDTVGWVGKNKFPNKTNTVGANLYTVDNNGYVSTSVKTDGRTWTYANSNIKFTLKKGTYKVRGYEKTASTSGYTGFHILDDSNNELLVVSNWNSFMTDALTLTLAQDTNIGVEYKLGNGEYAFMIAEEKQYNLSPAYESYHESVEEVLQKLIGSEDIVSLETGLSVWTINKVVKYGNVCTLNLSITASTAITTSALIGTLPTGFRPSAILYVPVGHPNYNAVVKLDTNGEITFTPPADVSVTNICIVATFVVQTAPANREISADIEPEYKYQAKKATKKKIIKEEEE